MNISSLIQQAQPQAQGPQGVASLVNGAFPATNQPAPPAQPAPNHEQTLAAYYRLQETKRLMGNILQNPKTGRENVRPLVMDAGATLIGERLQSLAEFMRGLETFPPADNPLAQKQWIRRLRDVSAFAQRKLLQDHRAANPPDWQHGPAWNADSHSEHMAGALAHYGS